MKAPPSIEDVTRTRCSEMDRYTEDDVESPEEPTRDSLAQYAENPDRESSTKEAKGSTTTQAKVRYSVKDIQGDHNEALAEGDFIESMERSSRSSGQSRSARDVLLEGLASPNIEFLEDSKANEVSPTSKNSTNSSSLRDLTAELIMAKGESDTNRKGSYDGVTRGTASHRMAEAAGLLFSSRDKRRYGSPAAQSSKKQNEPAQSEPRNTYQQRIHAARAHIKESRERFVDFIEPRKAMLLSYWWIRLKWLILPGTVIAALMFYVFGNPPHGKLSLVDGKYVDPQTGTAPFTASVSWWILFVAVRQVITFSSAEMWELLIVDFLVCRTGFLNPILGPYLSLWIAQSKGWPFRATVWGLTNFAVLSGSRKFPNHWGYFQDTIHMFNGRNPSGNVLENPLYTNIIYCCIMFGLLTSVKRAMLSNVMGKRLVINYGDQLERLMKSVLLVTRIAVLARKVAKNQLSKSQDRQLRETSSSLDSPEGSTSSFSELQAEDFYSGEDQEGMLSVLEEWDEPELVQERLLQKNVTIASLLHFRRALAFVDVDYPFSEAFGPASTRQLCVESSQDVFERLARGGDEISMGVFTPLVKDPHSETDQEKVKDLVKLLQPSRHGTLTKLDFVKSIDEVYRTMRTLIAAIESASQIEQNYESIVNAIFYWILGLIALGVLKFNVQAIITSLGAFFVGVGFIIGNACSKFLEGLLMIFIRRPYEVGDRIAVGSVTVETNPDGSNGWIVEKVDLYSTTVRFARTRELATISNGDLAPTRIINLYRSQKAIVYINLNFGIDVPNEKIEYLKSQVQEFVAARPREWVALSGFRLTDVQANLGYVAYTISLQHRDSWQYPINIAASKAELTVFALELSKELGMRFVTPSVPIELSMKNTTTTPTTEPSLETLIGELENKKFK